jgi:hypothetical protein
MSGTAQNTCEKAARTLALALAALFASGAAGQQSASGIVGFLDRADAPPLEAVAAEMQTEESWLRRADFGSIEANDYIHLLADADVPTLQYVADKYYLFSSGEGSWGDGWLSKFVVYDLGMRAYELGNRLSDGLREQVNRIMADAVSDATFRVDLSCGLDVWNSCSEDFGSMLKTVAMVRQLFPEVVARVGDEPLLRLEEKYFRLAFSTEHGFYALTIQLSPIDGNRYVMMNNHGDQSAVYGGILLTELANALYVYWVAGRPLPAFYSDKGVLANIRSLFSWLQLTATPDGQSFLNACLNVRGDVGPCNDPHVSNATPRFVPAGRAVRILLGEAAFRPDLYDFQSFDATYDAGNCWNRGRKVQFDARNPAWVSVRESATPTSTTVSWEVQRDASRYEVWGPAGRIASTTSSSYTFDGVVTGATRVGIVVRGREYERVTAVGFSSSETPRIVRRHLHP